MAPPEERFVLQQGESHGTAATLEKNFAPQTSIVDIQISTPLLCKKCVQALFSECCETAVLSHETLEKLLCFPVGSRSGNGPVAFRPERRAEGVY